MCKFPAERPIFTNDFCHPCSRILWNIKVLKDEERHKEQHLAGECLCEVIFEGEDREKRLRPRSGKGKAKAAHGEARSGDGSGGKFDESGAGRGRRHENVGLRHATSRGRGHEKGGSRFNQRHEDAGRRRDRGVDVGDRGMYGHVDRSQDDAGMRAGGDYEDRGEGQGSGFGIGHNAEAGRMDFGADESYGSVISGLSGLQMHADPEAGHGHLPRQDWDRAAKEAAYQYVGYVGNDAHQEAAVPDFGYGAATIDGHYASHLVWEGQAMMGQSGAGMKWYPQHDPSSPGSTNAEMALPAPKNKEKRGKKQRTWSKSYSEPTNYQAFAESIADDAEQQQPAVVSSDMAKPGH